MNDTHTIESALPMLEFAPKEVKLGAAGVVGVALIAYYLNNKVVVNMLTRRESVVNSLYSFFHSKKSDNSVEVTAALTEFTQLVAAMKVEREDLIMAILNKQSAQYDSNVVNFLQELHVQVANYPELPNGVALTADEIKQVIKDRQDHHAKIILAISHYLESTPEDEYTEHNNTIQEIK